MKTKFEIPIPAGFRWVEKWEDHEPTDMGVRFSGTMIEFYYCGGCSHPLRIRRKVNRRGYPRGYAEVSRQAPVAKDDLVCCRSNREKQKRKFRPTAMQPGRLQAGNYRYFRKLQTT